MPGRGTPKYGIRVPDELWERFGEAVDAAGYGHEPGRAGGRTVVLLAFIRWYLREPGATLPRRPGP